MSELLKGILRFARAKRFALLTVSFVLLWPAFGAGYIAGTRGGDSLCALALAGFILCALPAALAQK